MGGIAAEKSVTIEIVQEAHLDSKASVCYFVQSVQRGNTYMSVLLLV